MALYVGSEGGKIRLYLTDDDGVARNIGTASTKKIYTLKPGTTTSVEHEASFVTDGSDGGLEWAYTAGFIDTAGNWLVQAYVVVGTAKYWSDPYVFCVDDPI